MLFKNILTDDIVKTGWTKIKVRYDITWDGESESYIYWNPDGITVSLAGNLYPMYKKIGKEISVVYYELYKNGEYKVEVVEKKMKK